jgi:hypothetical protein
MTKLRPLNLLNPLNPIALATLLALAACGGGGSSSTTAADTTTSASSTGAGTGTGTTTTPAATSGGTTAPSTGAPGTGAGTGTTTPLPTGGAPLPAPVQATDSTVMACVGGATVQCSGASPLRTENGITLTSSGVQAYGKSTSDLASPIVDVTTASGLAPAMGGVAELRVAKDASANVSSPLLVLRNLGITWDGKTERPLIIEPFLATAGRSQLDGTGALTNSAVPDSSDLSFFDYAVKGTAGTQANYANNRYFPRTGNPSRCPAGVTPCPTVETLGVQVAPGDWRTGGGTPDVASADRVHEDGDVHAGNGQPGPNNTVTILPGGSGVGVPYPGSKGYRSMQHYSFQYANLAQWLTQDTVDIAEWGQNLEHNQNRRGSVAYGAVTAPASVPTTGTASYLGTVRGWYNAKAGNDATAFRADAIMTVDFATRQVTITVQNPTSDGVAVTVPIGFKATVGMGAANSNVANYLTGAAAASSTLKGGVSGRYFGPVVSTGNSGNGPAEAGATFTLTDATSGQTVIGGFIARKQ